VFSDPNGGQDISWAYMLFQSHVCYVRYSRVTNELALRNDAGTAWLGPVIAGTAGTLGNKQCTLDARNSAAAVAGSLLTIDLALSFAPEFKGRKSNYAVATDQAYNTSGMIKVGTWDVPGRPPTVDSLTPSGHGSAYSFQFLASDPDGAADLKWVEVLINANLALEQACYIEYRADTNQLFLRNDSGTAWLAPVILGSQTTLRNKQCTLDAAVSSKSTSGQSLSLKLALVFTPAFGGQKKVYLSATDKTYATSGWQEQGTWLVPGASF
jgi:hypothetical protein